MDRDNAWRREQGIGLEQTVVLYAGTIGWVSGASIVVDAAERMKEREDLLFLFVGDGAVKDEIEKDATRRGLANMKFLPFQPRERLPEVQAVSDISLVTLAPDRGRTSVPSKVQGYMAAGRPVVASVGEDSETGKELLFAESGLVTAAGDVEALVNAIGTLADSADERRRLGKNARKRLEEYYARDVVLGKFENELETLVGRRS
jgi:colanic acid biosynthesis glycosyl transferase WcaI